MYIIVFMYYSYLYYIVNIVTATVGCEGSLRNIKKKV